MKDASIIVWELAGGDWDPGGSQQIRGVHFRRFMNGGCIQPRERH